MRPLLALLSLAALLVPWSPAASAAPRTHVVVIDKMKFGPAPPDVKAGDTIIWENRDIFRHTVTAKNGAFNIDLPAGAKGKTLIRAAGTIAISCKYHPGMRGVIKVAK